MGPGSRIYSIYERLPAPLQTGLVSLYGGVLRRRRYGPEHKRVLARILESRTWPLDRIRAYEWEKTQAIVRYAYASVPHYRETWKAVGFHPDDLRSPGDFSQIPITEKQMVKDDPWRFVADRYREHRKGIFVGHTSGTTGKPLVLVKNQDAYQRTWAFQERQRTYWGIDRLRPRASVHNRPVVPVDRTRPPFWRYNAADRQWMFSNVHLHERYLDSYLDKLAQIGPEELLGFASTLNVLAEHAIARGDDRIRPKVVVTFAETMYEHQREHLSEAFGCPIADQYGTSEVVVWAAQCREGTYHVNHEFGLFETVEGSTPVRGRPGEVVGTGFINEVQVLIRYRIGDVATLSDRSGDCACGWQTDHLDSIQGRVDDVLYSPEGSPVGRLDPIARNLPGVRECQIVQDDRDHLTVNLVAQAEPNEESEKAVTTRLHAFFTQAMRVDCVWMEEIPRTAAGKFRYQLNTWRPASGQVEAARVPLGSGE